MPTAKRLKVSDDAQLHSFFQDSIPPKKFLYGTAGFRDRATVLPNVLGRVGILAALRSQAKGGLVVGVMITASHNPEDDNGAKVVDVDGGMLSQSWEPHAESIVNAESAQEALAVLQAIYKEDGCSRDSPCAVILGRDTRPHSKALSDLAKTAAEILGAVVFDLGEVTTPQLHYVVMEMNKGGSVTMDPSTFLKQYYNTLAEGYISLIMSSTSPSHIKHVILDGSNGIGGRQVKHLVDAINESLPGALSVDLRNSVGDGPVNENCGAEIVQKSQVPPASISADKDTCQVIASFDGDADRIVFHSYLAAARWVLVDGDKIAALVSSFIRRELGECGWQDQYSFGVVQTAYANGASTAYLRSRGVDITFAKTGVKYLHEQAHRFDCGVYFEANGHGTVLFSPKLIGDIAVANAALDGAVDRRALAIKRLHACTQVINQAVGDAMSGLLICLAILNIDGMSFEQWTDMYTDLPSKQLKMPVPNKRLIVCSADEASVEAPADLQLALNAAMQKTPCGRAFVRPSGTEDCVRIYAEAETQDAANKLADEAVLAIRFFVI